MKLQRGVLIGVSLLALIGVHGAWAQTCEAFITGSPASVHRGETFTVFWQVDSDLRGPHTNVHFRPADETAERGGQVFPFPAGVSDHQDTIDSSRFEPGTDIRVRVHVWRSDGLQCYSQTRTVRVLEPENPPCEAALIDPPNTVAQGLPLALSWQVDSPVAGPHTNLHYRVAGGCCERPGQVFAFGAGTQTFSDLIPTGQFDVGSQLEVRAHARTGGGMDCFTPIATILVTAPVGPECEAELLEAPLAVIQGDPITVQWRASSRTNVPHTNLHYRLNDQTRERPGVVFSFPGGTETLTDTIDTTGLSPDTLVTVRTHVRNGAGQDCYSEEASLIILAREPEPCETQMTAIPSSVRRGQLLLINWRVTSADPGSHTNLHYRLVGSPVEHPTPVHSFPSGATDFGAFIDTSTFPMDSEFRFLAHARTNRGVNCYSPASVVRILPPGPVGSIEGFVLTEDDEPLQYARVEIITGASQTGVYAFTDQTGAYELINLSPGPYVLAASKNDYETVEQSGIMVERDQATRIDFWLPSLLPPAPGRIAGFVRDQDSNPVEDAQVRITAGPDHIGNAALTDETGAYALEGLTPGTYSLRAHRSGYASDLEDSATVESEETTRVDFQIMEGEYTPGAIAGVIEDGEGEPIEGAEVEIRAGPGDVGKTATTDAEGEYRLADLEPGTYTVRASADGFETDTRTSIEVHDGLTTTVDFALPATSASSAGGSERLAARILSAAIDSRAGLLTTVVAVEAPGAARVHLAWAPAGGPTRHTATQRGRGSFRAVFSVPVRSARRVQVQAIAEDDTGRATSRVVEVALP